MSDKNLSANAIRMRKYREKRRQEDPDFINREAKRLCELRKRKRKNLLESGLKAIRRKETAKKRLQRAKNRIQAHNIADHPLPVSLKSKTMEVDELINLNNLTTHEISDKVGSGELVLWDRPGRSKVWTVFAVVMSTDGVELEFVYCKICSRVYKHAYAQTSNLIRHNCYVEKFKNADNETSMIESEKPSVLDVETFQNLSKLFTKWIINDFMPYELIKSQDLQAIFHETIRLGSKFGNGFDIGKLLPPVPVIQQNVSIIYGRCFEQVKAEIASIKDNGFALTTDIWTDGFSKRRYIVLTIHYLKDNVLTFRLMGLKAFEVGITDENIIGKVENILEDFDCKLSRKSIIVTNENDGGLKAIPDTENLPSLSQLLNSALLKSIEECPKVTQIILSSTKLIRFLEKSSLNANISTLLQTSGSNCWLTSYKMLQSIDCNWDEIEKLLENSEENFDINIYHLRALINTLQPFEDAIESLEDDTHSTLHLVIVYLHELKKSCGNLQNEFDVLDFIENLKERIQFCLEKIVMENITNLHKLALFLFPPANKLLRFNDKERKSVEDDCARLMKCFGNELKMTEGKPDTEQPTSSPYSQKNFFADFVISEKNFNTDELIIQEIQYYKNMRVVNSPDLNVFKWWKQQKDSLPILSKLSCTVLATPATNAASRRFFSTARSLLCEKYKQDLRDTDIEQIMFLKSNLNNPELESSFVA